MDGLGVTPSSDLVEVLAQEQLGKTEDARERRTQLVRNGGDQVGLEPHRLVRREDFGLQTGLASRAPKPPARGFDLGHGGTSTIQVVAGRVGWGWLGGADRSVGSRSRETGATLTTYTTM